LPSEVFQKV